MALSKEVRLLQNKWITGNSWPLRLEWLEIVGIRGWTGQRVDFSFPIVALVGENGTGKSTILQSAASVYRSPKGGKIQFASKFFPDTPWDKITKASIRWSVREGVTVSTGSVRKETSRWRGNPERRERNVEYIDLSRIQPVPARVGYSRLAKAGIKEKSSVLFDAAKLGRLSSILGRGYGVARMSLTEHDAKRHVPVIKNQDAEYSGFHGGAGETAMVELLEHEIPPRSIVLIDEIETSLHPRAQRRLMRDLAEVCRVKELQIILSTHSPYVLEELPPEARLYVWEGAAGRSVIKGVSPEFAMTRMDLEQHPECDIYVEDDRAEALIREVMVHTSPELVSRCLIVPFGAASVGQSLGLMVAGKRFPRPSCVFLDGDQPPSNGCSLLPGGDAPERVVFDAMKAAAWPTVAQRVGRSHSNVVDACERAMTTENHHEWVRLAADELVLGGSHLWQALCAGWATQLLNPAEGKAIVTTIEQAIDSH
jgi:predicted ATPase